MLFVLIQQVIEDLLVKKSDALKVIAAARLKAHDLINKAIRLMTQASDVLLSLHLLANIGGVIANLELDSVEGR